MGIPDHFTWLLRNTYIGQEATVRTNVEQRPGSKLGKEYIKTIYCCSAYLAYVQSTSCEMPSWMKHKLESRLVGETLITSDMQMLLLLLLSRFSSVWLCATPETAAHQASRSLGFSRQEHWSGLPFPSPMQESAKWKEVAQSCPTLSDPTDCSLTGSSVRGSFQARVLEWGAGVFSDLWS